MPCAAKGRRGRTGRPSQQIEKRCPACDGLFKVPPSRSAAVCCSVPCAAAYKRNIGREGVREFSEADAAWLAGLFDGEGSIVLSERSRPGGGSVRIQISNTYMPLLDHVRAVTGVGYVHVRKSRNPRHSDSMWWTVHGGAALKILWRMRPWLIVKAERTDAVLAGKTFPRLERWDRIYPPVV